MIHRGRIRVTTAWLLFISVIASYGPIVPGEGFYNTALSPKGRAFAPNKAWLPLIPKSLEPTDSAFSSKNNTARFAVSVVSPGGSSTESISFDPAISLEESRAHRLASKAFSKEGFITIILPLAVLLTYLCKSLPNLPVSFGTLGLLFDGFLTNYKNSMVVHPLQTKVATGVTLAVLGDATAQMRESKSYDSRRAVSFAGFDSCYRVFQHFAFPFIVRSCQGNILGNLFSVLPNMVVTSKLRHLFATAERTFAYQFFVIPFFYYPVFFTFTGLIQGLTLKETFARAKANFFPCWKRNIMFWVPIQMVMFGLIDEKWQIPFVCLMGMIWSTILSVTAGKAKPKEA